MTAIADHLRTDELPYDDVIASPPGRLVRTWRGKPDDPSWVRPSLLALLFGTALLYVWDLSASGYANSFYAAAVQAGSQSWKAMLFGSLDAGNLITVDKPPASLWVMDLSARLFGLSSWSLLVPQALEGVAAVGLLYAAVRRVSSPAAALLAGAVLALTPVAALMFRYNNPDALLVLTLVGAAYATTRALEAASTRWLALAGALVGLGFLTKMLQALVVVPVLAGVYLLAAPTSVRRRLGQLLAAGGALVLSAGWWVALVSLWPAGARPYIGGSQTNSILELTFGYNGFGRLTGNETGSVGGGAAGQTGRWGATGLLRMFNSEMGGQISWLIPAALLLLVAGLWARWQAPRTDRVRAALLLWGGWLLLTGVVFSLAKGIIHPYYTVALAPAIGALVGIGSVQLWQRRHTWFGRGTLAAVVLVSTWWSNVLLRRSPTWHPELRTLIVGFGLTAGLGLLAAPYLHRRAVTALLAAAVVVGLAGPAAASLQTAATPHTGAIPSAGPAVVGGNGPGGFGGRGGGGGGGRFGGGPPAGAFGGGPPGGGGPRGGGQGGLGGLLDASTPDAALVSALMTNADSYTWVAAAVGANSAAGVQIATGKPVMALGGFNGSDPSPTLAQFQQYVAQGKVHYFLGGGGRGGFGGQNGGSSTTSEITAWVEAHYTATTIGGVTVYDLTASAS
ncbi:MAG: glycosyl transferase family 39 [Frankiales bacterium]|nr:glycosyl transferase family 39 [Frankiales bacterium]